MVGQPVDLNLVGRLGMSTHFLYIYVMRCVGPDILFNEIKKDVKILKPQMTETNAPLGRTVRCHSQG
jgi:hypothetical protein